MSNDTIAPFLVQIINSKQDVNGNRYFAIIVTRLGGESIVGEISGGASNVRSALREMFGDWEAMREHCFIVESEIGKREFRQVTKDAPYAGCGDAEIVEFITSFLKGGA